MQAQPVAVLIGKVRLQAQLVVVAAVPPLLWRHRMTLPVACGRGELLPTPNGSEAPSSNRTLAVTPASLGSNHGAGLTAAAAS